MKSESLEHVVFMISFHSISFSVYHFNLILYVRFPSYVPIDDNSDFRTFLVKSMRNFSDITGHSAFFWECKPVSRIGLSATSFEYVLIPSTELEGNVK